MPGPFVKRGLMAIFAILNAAAKERGGQTVARKVDVKTCSKFALTYTT